jgi:hypothetical protein
MMQNQSIEYKRIEKVSQIRVVDKRVNTEYKWYDTYEKRKCFGRKETKSNIFVSIMGGYEGGSFEYFNTKEDILEYKLDDGRDKYMIENNVVYHRPYVCVSFDSKHIDGHTMYFNTFNEAKLWAETFIVDNGFSEKLIQIV